MKRTGEKNVPLDMKPLTALQVDFVEAFFECDEQNKCIMKRMGWVDRSRVNNMLRSDRVRLEIATRKKDLQVLAVASQEFAISKSRKMELLMEVAEAGAERGFDKMGNSILVNPQSTIQAIRELNVMQGHHAPVVTEQKVEVINRSELEIKAHIAALTQEYTQLLALEGEFEEIEG